jgi:hypothetical protein
LGYTNVLILNPDYKLINWVQDYYLYKQDVTRLTDFKKYQSGISGGVGLKYHINDKSYLIMNGEFEYRFTTAQTGNFFDYQKISSLIFNIGYCVKIK